MSERCEVGLIGGVGQSDVLEDPEEVVVRTPYGPTSTPVHVGLLGGRRTAFILRRGVGDALLPQAVPYRANVWALASLGVTALITTTASSGLREAFSPGTYVVADQVIDLTHERGSTFFTGDAAVQLAEPQLFDARLRALASEVLADLRVRYREFGTVVVPNGPRFSTAAEARWFAGMGADLTNMTLMPETALALELGLAVVNLSFITDRAAFATNDYAEAPNLELVRLRSTQAQPVIKQILTELVRRIPERFVPTSAIPPALIRGVLDREPVGADGAAAGAVG